MSDRFRDFDAWWDEQGRKPLRLKIFGETHELAADLPAPLALRFTRLAQDVKEGKRDENDAFNESEILEVGKALFGAGVMQGWLDRTPPIGLTQLTEIVTWALDQYRGDAEDEDEGEAEAPATGATQPDSSSTGPSSKPTSIASTPG